MLFCLLASSVMLKVNQRGLIEKADSAAQQKVF